MEAIKPITKSPHLKSVSTDHHNGLLLCWKIREGFHRDIDLVRIKQYVSWYWTTHLMEHFLVEEQYIFSILGNEHPLVRKALAEHRRLKRLFMDKTEIWRSLNQIEEELDAHIRFEEKVLFKEVQKVATETQLALIDNHSTHTSNHGEWPDEFWKQ